MLKSICFLLLFFQSFIVLSQSKGQIEGVILDKAYNNEPLAFANVVIKDTSIGTTTDMNGKFILSLEPGTYTVLFSFIGYETKQLSSIVVTSDKLTKISITLAPKSNNLDEVIISEVTKKESDAALLTDQRKAVEMKTAIGAQEISKKGVSDVATAVTKASGISRQEGSGNVYVRGLGDRYNFTMLNGLPIPSNNPRTKNIDLNIFSTDIVENISINKTSSPEDYADFSGASIDIISKIHSGNTYLQIKLGGGINSNAIGINNFYLQQGPNSTGFYNQSYDSNVLKKYTFNSWDKIAKTEVFDKDFSINAGKTFLIGNTRLSAFVTAGHRNDFRYLSGISRGNVNVQNLVFNDFKYENFKYSTNTTAMASLYLNINTTNNIKFTSFFVNSSEQSHREYKGVINVFDNAINGGGFIRRSNFDRTTVFVNQFLGKHKINKFFLEWAAGYNNVSNIIPNRMQNTLVPRDNDDFSQGLIPSNLSAADNNRYYQDLLEDEFVSNVKLKYNLNEDNDKNHIELGYSMRLKKVAFNAIQFNMFVNRSIRQPNVDINNLDGYFNQGNIDSGFFKIRTFRGDVDSALDPQVYDGNQDIHGFFGSLQYQLTNKLIALVGLRAEIINQNISWQTQIDPVGDSNDYDVTQILPNLSLKYELSDKQNIKIATSKTYTLPQFKERAPFQFQYVTSIEFGNPNLYASSNYNFDIKWEFFPKSEELISATIFGKYIQNPINRVVVASATNDLSFINTGSAAVAFGTELEMKKILYNFSNQQQLSGGFNISYMYDSQDFDNKKVTEETDLSVFFTNEEGGLTGASDLLVNADLTYRNNFSENRDILTTLSYNIFSERIYAIGSSGKGNQVDSSVGTLDFIIKSQIFKDFYISASIKNILNPTIKRFQINEDKNVELLTYQKGINTGVSFTYKF